jgi:hypothetical protein
MLLATAREGYIAETLSALEMAMEVDRAAANGVDVDEMSTMLMHKTNIIALEEVGIRRLRGVPFTRCVVPTVLRVLASSERRPRDDQAGRCGATIAYCGDTDTAKTWSRLYEALVPFVTMKERLRTWASMMDCTKAVVDTDESNVTGLLAQNILRGF